MPIKRHRGQVVGLDYELPPATCCSPGCSGPANVSVPVAMYAKAGARHEPDHGGRYWCWDCWDRNSAKDWRDIMLERRMAK